MCYLHRIQQYPVNTTYNSVFHWPLEIIILFLFQFEYDAIRSQNGAPEAFLFVCLSFCFVMDPILVDAQDGDESLSDSNHSSTSNHFSKTSRQIFFEFFKDFCQPQV